MTIRNAVLILLIAQVASFLFLFWRMASIDARLEVEATKRILDDKAITVRAPQEAMVRAGSAASDQTIRTIIKEEIDVLSDRLASLEERLATMSDVRPQPPAPVLSPQEVAERTAAFNTEFNKALSVGNVDPLQMAALEQAIAALPEEQRRAALSRLSRAMSDGTIKARF